MNYYLFHNLGTIYSKSFILNYDKAIICHVECNKLHNGANLIRKHVEISNYLS